MTLVNIDLRNAGYETGPDDRVVFHSPANRNEQGTIISTAETSVALVDGQASKELAPGPVVVQILAQGVADTRPKSGYVPDEGPVSLWDVILDWTPALVDQGILAILASLENALGQVSGAVDSALGDYFTPPSTNLFDRDDVLEGWILPVGSGTPTESSRFSLTPPIPVEGGAPYTGVNLLRTSWFSETGFISSVEGVQPGEEKTWVAPIDATHVRLSVNDLYLDTAQLNLGTTLLPYEQGGGGGVKVDRLPQELWFPLTPGDIGAQPAGDYLEGRVTPELTSFFEMPTNLVNPAGVLADSAIPAGTGEIGPSGAGSWVTAPIPVVGGQEYTLNRFIRATFYDTAGQYVGFVSASSTTEPDVVTAPPSSRTVRLTVARARLESVQMNLGPELLPYEPGGGPKIPAHYLDITSIPGGEPGDPPAENPATYDRAIIDMDGLMEVYTGPEIAAHPDVDNDTAADVHGWYDALMADHPEYVTRRDLGLASDGVHHLYAYTLRPPEVPHRDDGTHAGSLMRPLPTALLVSGVHAYERAAVHHVWRLAKALCEEWATSRVLEAMRWNFEIIIIPVANPYAYTAPGVNRRHNFNGVDISRNMSAGWSATQTDHPQYSGPAPLSEAENQLIDGLIQEVKDRLVMGCDFHNFSTPAGSQSMLWQSAASEYGMNLGKKLISRMSRKWRADHAWITAPGPYFGYSTPNSSGGTLARQFVSYGVSVASSFETSRLQRLDGGSGEPHGARAMTLGYEAVVNYVAMGLHAGLKYRES